MEEPHVAVLRKLSVPLGIVASAIALLVIATGVWRGQGFGTPSVEVALLLMLSGFLGYVGMQMENHFLARNKMAQKQEGAWAILLIIVGLPASVIIGMLNQYIGAYVAIFCCVAFLAAGYHHARRRG